MWRVAKSKLKYRKGGKRAQDLMFVKVFHGWSGWAVGINVVLEKRERVGEAKALLLWLVVQASRKIRRLVNYGCIVIRE